MYLKAIKLSVVALSLTLISSCLNNTEQKSDSPSQPIYADIAAKIISPARHDTFRLGDQITFRTELSQQIDFDSIELIVNNLTQYKQRYCDTVIWKSNNARTGTNYIKIVFKGKNITIGASTTINFLALNKPKIFEYKIVNTYPHDSKAYTQGLISENGFMYESTGQYNESSLRKVDLKTGKILQQYDLPSNDFGEGIALYNDKIYMLTWESKKGYVFDFKTFNLINEFPISTEGWGLTYDGEYLIRSDGSHILYFINPEQFTEVYTLEIYDDRGRVTRLNELEYYDGKIWANIYGQDYIVTIDPHSGQLLEKIILTGLLTSEDRKKHRVDVLNGIAWDKTNARLFVTGKLWPKLFEIELVAKE